MTKVIIVMLHPKNMALDQECCPERSVHMSLQMEERTNADTLQIVTGLYRNMLQNNLHQKGPKEM